MSASCPICLGTGWETVSQGVYSGVRRCGCRAVTPKPEGQTPIDDDSITYAVEALDTLAFFPRGNRLALTVIGDAIASMCGSVEALRYMVRRACSLYKTWDQCGIPGLRQIVCSLYRPADGIESGGTEMYPDGIPSERQESPPRLPAGAQLALPPGQVSADPKLEEIAHELFQKLDMKAARKPVFRIPPVPPVGPDGEFLRDMPPIETDARFERILSDLTTAPRDRPEPTPTPQVITQEDIDIAVQKFRENKKKLENREGGEINA
jgi:hypothetical protein